MSSGADRLAALAAGLCQDAGISLEVRPGPWAWDALRQVLSVDARDLDQLGPEACAGLLTLEIGRFFVSRHRLFHVDAPSELGARILLDALDSVRAERWMRSRYAGVGVWMDAAGKRAADPAAPPFLQLCAAIAAGQVGGLHPEARAVLAQTDEARRAHRRMLPPDTLDHLWRASVAHDYRNEVLPRLPEDRWLPGPAEQQLQLAAARALEIAEEGILPPALALLQQDLDAVSAYLRSGPRVYKAGQDALGAGEAARFVAEAASCRGGDGKAPVWVQQLARRLYDAALSGGRAWAVVTGSRYRPGRGTGAPLPELPPLELRPVPPTDYDAALTRVAPQVDGLVRHLGEILQPRKRLRARAGYPSGRRVDLQRLMQFEADPRRYDELWIRSTIPDRREVSVLLLVDLSGSMSGDKAHCAVLGSVLLAETLHRLKTPFAIYGFQDVLIPFCDFSDALTDASRQAISQMAQEVEGARTGGNNHPAYNDDGPCLQEAAALLLEQSSSDRVLIVVSDGEPAGRRSSAEDLRRAVRELSKPESGLQLIALGLGPNTGHVANYYQDAEANVPVEQFAARVGAVAERVLLR